MKLEENKAWQAKWIWDRGYPWTTDPAAHELVYFRRTFHVEQVAQTKLVLHVSADSRYRLYVNGHSVAVGPCKGDASTHYYETVDVSDQLVHGNNVLAAKVLHYPATNPHQMGESGPISITRSQVGAFLLEGALEVDGDIVEVLHSNEQWKCKRESGYYVEASSIISWLGGMERIDGSKLAHGWEQIDVDDTHWQAAIVIEEPDNGYGELTPWQLTARPIPPLYEKTSTFIGVTNVTGIPRDDAKALVGLDAMSLPPHASVVVELDAGELTTGYIQAVMTGGRGSDIRMLYAECYEDPASEPSNRLKGVRDRTDGKLIGEYDQYIVAGTGTADRPEVYEPFSFRTFRYVRLEIEVGEEALQLHSYSYRETGYPLQIQAHFECSDADFNNLWELAQTTLKRCMHETYEDCPYYEQLQYTMDTRLQMMFTYNVSADDRLARRTLHDYHSSALPSGMLQSRYPSVYRQVIPSFSLYWIFMLYDHYQHFGDITLLKRYRHTVTALLDWFDRRLTKEGLVDVTPRAYWAFFDWVEQWPKGEPPAHQEGPLTLLSQMYSVALQRAAVLFEATAWNDVAQEARERAVAVNDAVRKYCWRADRQLFADGPTSDDFSQHTQIWSVACGLVQGEAAMELIERAMNDEELAILSLPMTYELFRVLSQEGIYHLSTKQWERWRAFLNLHLTTMPERTHGQQRSDCHAWSALPLSEFPGEILGVQPAAPGYDKIRIAPQTLSLTWASGKVATCHGNVLVDWKRVNGWFEIAGKGPESIPIELVLPNGKRVAFPTGGQFEGNCYLKEC